MAGDGPYNGHLVGDAGVGFLAVGVVPLLAAVWMAIPCDPGCVRGGNGARLALPAVPPPPPERFVGVADSWMSNGGLAFGMLIALVILVAVSRARANPDLLPAARAGVTAPRTSPETPRAQLSRAIPINKEES